MREMYEHAPQAVAAFPGAEIVGHGRSNSERQGTLNENDERALIAETTAAIEKHSGARPRGWLGPWISQSHVTPDLLQEAGYNYLLDWCHDDQPVWMKTRKGRILSVPYPQELNDIPQIVARKREGAEFADMIVDAFDVLHAECEQAPAGDGHRAARLHRRPAAPLQASQARAQPHRAQAPTRGSGSPPRAPSPRTRRGCRRERCPSARTQRRVFMSSRLCFDRDDTVIFFRRSKDPLGKSRMRALRILLF